MIALNPDDLIAKVDSALETMCFVMADCIGTDELEETPSIRAWIRFHNETEQGCVELGATYGFIQEVGSGLLGIDTSEIEEGEQAQGVLLELANVIAGEVVCLLGGEEIFFELGIPSAEVSQVDAPSEHVSIAFDLMGETLCVDVERGRASGHSEAA